MQRNTKRHPKRIKRQKQKYWMLHISDVLLGKACKLSPVCFMFYLIHIHSVKRVVCQLISRNIRRNLDPGSGIARWLTQHRSTGRQVTHITAPTIKINRIIASPLYAAASTADVMLHQMKLTWLGECKCKTGRWTSRKPWKVNYPRG